MRKLPVYRVDFNEDSEMLVNSIVEEPAIEINFIKLSQNKVIKLDNDLREIYGVVIPANKPIYYYSDKLQECYIVFDQSVIKKIVFNYFKNNRFNLIDVNHDFNIKTDDVVLLETYFAKKENDFNVDEGSWIVRYKVINDELWDLIKQGKLNGFSIYGKFGLEQIEFKNKKNINVMDLLKKLKKLISLEINGSGELERFITIDGKEIAAVGGLKEGNMLLIVLPEDGVELPADEGEYIIIKDGSKVIIKVNAEGYIEYISDVIEENEISNEEQSDIDMDKVNKIIEEKLESDVSFSEKTLDDENFKLSMTIMMEKVKQLDENYSKLLKDMEEVRNSLGVMMDLFEKRLKFKKPIIPEMEQKKYNKKIF